MDFVKLADVLVTAILAVVGFYLAHSYRRQIVLRVAEQRLSVYAKLWSKMSVATPVRTVAWNVPQPLTAKECEELFRALTAWYFEDGNGMLLGDGTRTLYLCVKDNLVRPIEHSNLHQSRITCKSFRQESKSKRVEPLRSANCRFCALE